MSNRKILSYLVLGASMLLLLSGCVTVRPYQKAYLNDAEMEMGRRPSEAFEQNFQLYREAASGANGGKNGGGCGCN